MDNLIASIVTPSPVEMVAVALAFFAVVMQWREHASTWWLVIVSSALYAKIFLDAGLFWDPALQIIFIGVAARGLFSWRPQSDLSMHMHPMKFHLWVIGAFGILSWVLSLLSAQLRTIGNFIAFVDATIFVFSIVALVLTERKVVESWWYWIFIDIVSAMLYWTKDLVLTSILYALYVPLAVIGLRAWQNKFRELHHK